jgi:hypothetical protein
MVFCVLCLCADHLALMMELMGKLPKRLTKDGQYPLCCS